MAAFSLVFLIDESIATDKISASLKYLFVFFIDNNLMTLGFCGLADKGENGTRCDGVDIIVFSTLLIDIGDLSTFSGLLFNGLYACLIGTNEVIV